MIIIIIYCVASRSKFIVKSYNYDIVNNERVCVCVYKRNVGKMT